MLEPFLYQMAILCFSSNTRVAVALCLLLILWGCCSDHLISTFLTLFVLVLSPSAILVIRRIGKAHERASRSLEEKRATTELEAAAGSEVASLESKGLMEREITSTASCMGNTGLFERDEDNIIPSASRCSDFDVCHSAESSEDSMSDDENLIEISLPDGLFVAREEPKALLKPLPLSNGCLLNPLQDSLRQRGLTELLSEINEEDNLIEIDIIRGSIKCSRVGIKA